MMKAQGLRLLAWVLMLLAGTSLLLLQTSPINAAADKPGQETLDPVYVLTLNDEIITPITAEYITEGINEASEKGAHLVILQLDTPGGLLSSTHTIVKDILNAPLPVVVYVAPAGARAGSAGVFITLSGHIAAMEPSTHIGAAHPVDSDGSWPTTSKDEQAAGENNTPPPDIMSEKVLNDTVAFMRSIAHARNRNETWAVRAITHSESITADEAHANDVVDILAPGINSLLRQIDGTQVKIGDKLVTIDCNDPEIINYEFSHRQQFLNLLANPVLAYILMMVAFYGIIFEVTHPGLGVSGAIGVVCLILALLGMQAMSINMAGLGLVLLGLGLFVAEIFTTTFGGFLAAGIVCVVLGSVMLYQTNEPFLQQSIPYIIIIALVAMGLLGFILYKILKTYRNKPVDPLEKLVGQKGRVTLGIKPGEKGKIKVYGEVWDATSSVEGAGLDTNTEITVVGIDPDHPRTLKVAKVFTKESI